VTDAQGYTSFGYLAATGMDLAWQRLSRAAPQHLAAAAKAVADRLTVELFEAGAREHEFPLQVNGGVRPE
jgi:hypothetical protein